MSNPDTNPIVFYDGLCGLCNGLVQFLLKRDPHHRLRFASLQSHFANEVLTSRGANPTDLDTMYVLLDHEMPGERLLSRSDAVLFLVSQLAGAWWLLSTLSVLPRTFRDFCYEIVAKNRYRVFGKYDSCMMPEPGYRDRFLDVT